MSPSGSLIVVALLVTSLLVVAPCTAADASGAPAVAPAQGPAAGVVNAEQAGISEYTQGRCVSFGHIEAASAVVFFVVALLLGLLAYHPLAWLPVPYTAILLVREQGCPQSRMQLGSAPCAQRWQVIAGKLCKCLRRHLELCLALPMRLAPGGMC